MKMMHHAKELLVVVCSYGDEAAFEIAGGVLNVDEHGREKAFELVGVLMSC